MFVMMVRMVMAIQIYYTIEPERVVKMINVCDDGEGGDAYPDLLHNGA